MADLLTGRRQRAHIVGVEARKPLGNPIGEPLMREELPERVRGGREAARHAYAGGGKLADQFAEAGVLAADRLDIAHPQLFERYDQGGRQLGCRHGKTTVR